MPLLSSWHLLLYLSHLTCNKMPNLARTKAREVEEEKSSDQPFPKTPNSQAFHLIKYQICFVSDNLKIFEVNQTPPSIAQN